jgi:hypothetical protein
MDPSAEEAYYLIKLLQKFYQYQLEPFIVCINQSSRSSNMISLKCLKMPSLENPQNQTNWHAIQQMSSIFLIQWISL